MRAGTKPKTGFAAVLLVCVVLSGASLPDDAAALSRFDSQIQSGDYTGVRAPLEKYTAEHSGSWRAFYQLGYVYFRLHEVGKSLSMLSKSLALNSEFAQAHKILAFDLNIMGRQALAIRELQYALRLDPQSAECHYELGRIFYEQGSYPAAVEQLETAKKLDPQQVNVYHNLGLAYTAMNENAAAVANFEEGLKRNAAERKPSAWPLINYATYFNLRNEYARARDLLVRAVEMDPGWEKAYEELSKAYRGLGEPQKAIDSLQHALAINPHKPEYHYVLARLYTQTHQAALARQEMTAYEQDRQRAAGGKATTQ